MYVKNPIRFVSTSVTVTSGAFGMLLLDYVTMGLKTASNPEEIVGCILVCVQVLSLQNMNLPTFPSPFPFLAHLKNRTLYRVLHTLISVIRHRIFFVKIQWWFHGSFR